MKFRRKIGRKEASQAVNAGVRARLRGVLGIAFIVLLGVGVTSSCRVKYSFTGASIHQDAKTVSVAYFPNNATMVAPILSTTFTEALKDRFARQTKLSVVREDGDLSFEGEIVNYMSTPSAISGDEYAEKNRLTITVRVRFKNRLEPRWDFPNRSFTAFQDYDSSQLLQNVEESLIDAIVKILVDDIFNAATSNW